MVSYVDTETFAVSLLSEVMLSEAAAMSVVVADRVVYTFGGEDVDGNPIHIVMRYTLSESTLSPTPNPTENPTTNQRANQTPNPTANPSSFISPEPTSIATHIPTQNPTANPWVLMVEYSGNQMDHEYE